MITYRLSIPLIGFLIAAWGATASTATAGDDAAAHKSPDQQFGALLAAAQKDASKADWRALRHAFAETSHYTPYSVTWRTELAKVGKDMRNGNRFDVITTEAKGGKPERLFYFNIDMPWKALESSLGKAFERSKQSGKKN